jgi:hypothetical protein
MLGAAKRIAAGLFAGVMITVFVSWGLSLLPVPRHGNMFSSPAGWLVPMRGSPDIGSERSDWGRRIREASYMGVAGRPFAITATYRADFGWPMRALSWSTGTTTELGSGSEVESPASSGIVLPEWFFPTADSSVLSQRRLPTVPMWGGFAVDVAGWAAVASVAIILLPWARHARRIRRGRCPECAYDLSGVAGRCPECGRERITAPAPAPIA